MTKFSANLGFLWADLSLVEAIHAAKLAGFDAVECHWPYGTATHEIKTALEADSLEMLGLNTSRGNVSNGEMGLCAYPDRIVEAQASIDEAVAYASQIGARNIHVMAGYAEGEKAHQTFLENLSYACRCAEALGISILIEPLNSYDVPGYFLSSFHQAEAIIGQLQLPNLKLMFDCYHAQLIHGDISNTLKRMMPIIGHIQFAGVPDRGAPDQGELAYKHIFQLISDLGYDRPLGAEYKPNKPTDQTLGWMKTLSP